MIFYIIFFIAIMGFFYYDTLSWLMISWINNPYYSHGILVPVISGYIIWNMRKELYSVEKNQSLVGLAIFIMSFILHSISVHWTIYFLSGISLVMAITGAILFLFGGEFLKKILFPILFLFLMIPIPFVDVITPVLQMNSANISSSIANFIGIPVVKDGLVLRIPGGAFEVGLECSGIRSILSLLTIAVLFSFILEGSMLMKLILILSSFPLAIAGNALRIVSILEIAQLYGKEAATNYFHDFSSPLVFIFAFFGLFLVGRCFGRLQFKKIF